MAGHVQASRIVAQDVEHPERQRRPAQVARQLPVHPAQQRQDAFLLPALADVRRAQRTTLHQVEDQHAGLRVQDRGRDAGGVGGAAGGQLVPAQDVVDGDVVADAHEAAARAVVDQEVGVGDAAAHRLRLHGRLQIASEAALLRGST